MFDAYYSKRAKVYLMPLRNIKYSLSDEIIFSFDTGSPYTVLSINSLYNRPHENKDRIFDALKGGSISSIQPSTAAGQILEGYACVVKNVTISGRSFKKLYFYIVTNIDKPLALIGDDIVSFCSFHHQRKSDICNIGFDEEGYVEEFTKENKNILDLNRLFEEKM
ncbi:MAG: hypothetical protein IK139_07260 [Lachnospiraceae bacterium]|nr:hypothetical protein [Lachnospiraceae bacterium]